MTILARVYFVRHGETDGNRKHIIQGQLDTTLNKTGLEQARLVGEVLQSIPFDIAYTSDLNRAVKTMEAILKHHPNVIYSRQEELRERHMGDLQGKVWRPWMEKYDADLGVESGVSFGARGESWWLKYILEVTSSLPKKEDPYHILVTTHGGFITVLLRTLKRQRRAVFGEGMFITVKSCLNTSVTIIEVDEEGKGVVVQLSDTKHLDGMTEDAVKDNADEQ